MHDRPSRATPALIALAVSFVVSVVHYTDNVVNLHHFPQGGVLGIPPPSAPQIAAAWVIFTLVGAFAAWSLLHGRPTVGSWALRVYSLSGLVGLGHYFVHGAADMPWWRHADVGADIACGLVLIALSFGTRRGADRAPLATSVSS
jgi:hypothetical protein